MLLSDPMEAGLLLGLIIAVLFGGGGFYGLWRIRVLERRIAEDRNRQDAGAELASSASQLALEAHQTQSRGP